MDYVKLLLPFAFSMILAPLFANQPLAHDGEISAQNNTASSASGIENIPSSGSFKNGHHTFLVLDGVYMESKSDHASSTRETSRVQTNGDSALKTLGSQTRSIRSTSLIETRERVGSLFGKDLYRENTVAQTATSEASKLGSGKTVSQNDESAKKNHLIVYNPVTQSVGLVEGEIMVMLKEGVEPEALESDYDVKVYIQFSSSVRGPVLYRVGDVREVTQSAALLEKDPRVEAVQIQVKEDNLTVF